MRAKGGDFPRCRAFSLVEVVLALGVFGFVVLSIMGLFAVGLKTSRESEQEIQAATAAATLLETRRAAPTAALAGFAITTNALNQAYGPAWSGGVTNYINADGYLTNVSSAAYRIMCRAGTNAATGPDVAQVYVSLSWPPQADSSAAGADRYEITTYIRNR